MYRNSGPRPRALCSLPPSPSPVTFRLTAALLPHVQAFPWHLAGWASGGHLTSSLTCTPSHLPPRGVSPDVLSLVAQGCRMSAGGVQGEEPESHSDSLPSPRWVSIPGSPRQTWSCSDIRAKVSLGRGHGRHRSHWPQGWWYMQACLLFAVRCVGGLRGLCWTQAVASPDLSLCCLWLGGKQ